MHPDQSNATVIFRCAAKASGSHIKSLCTLPSRAPTVSQDPTAPRKRQCSIHNLRQAEVISSLDILPAVERAVFFPTTCFMANCVISTLTGWRFPLVIHLHHTGRNTHNTVIRCFDSSDKFRYTGSTRRMSSPHIQSLAAFPESI